MSAIQRYMTVALLAFPIVVFGQVQLPSSEESVNPICETKIWFFDTIKTLLCDVIERQERIERRLDSVEGTVLQNNNLLENLDFPDPVKPVVKVDDEELRKYNCSSTVFDSCVNKEAADAQCRKRGYESSASFTVRKVRHSSTPATHYNYYFSSLYCR